MNCESFKVNHAEIMHTWPGGDTSRCEEEAVGYAISDHGNPAYFCEDHLVELAGPPWHAPIYRFGLDHNDINPHP